MASSVLVAYASRSGSTNEVARAVAGAFHEAGLEPRVAHVRELKSLGGAYAIILGAPLYMGRMPRELHSFLRRNRAALSSLPCWFFVLGPVRLDPADFTSAQSQAEKELAKHPWLGPAEVKVFGGRFDPQRMGFPFSLLRHLPVSPLRKMPAIDIRDWDAIHTWASGIAHLLRPAA